MTSPTKKPRTSIVTAPGYVRILIPRERDWGPILFVALWLLVWATGEIAVPILFLNALRNSLWGTVLFSTVWWLGWTVGGLYVISGLAWMLFGREVITVQGQQLTLRREALGMGKSRSYDLRRVAAFRIARPHAPSTEFRYNHIFSTDEDGHIAFEYESTTRRFAEWVDEAEARHLIALIEQRFGKAAA